MLLRVFMDRQNHDCRSVQCIGKAGNALGTSGEQQSVTDNQDIGREVNDGIPSEFLRPQDVHTRSSPCNSPSTRARSVMFVCRKQDSRNHFRSSVSDLPIGIHCSERIGVANAETRSLFVNRQKAAPEGQQEQIQLFSSLVCLPAWHAACWTWPRMAINVLWMS